MGKVYNFVNDGISETVEYINQAYRKGEIEGIIVGIKNKDDLYTILNSQTLNQLEGIGLTECIKQSQFYEQY